MLIGVPKEIKNHEYRIGLTPAGARELVAHGHQVIVQRDGGKAIGLTNEMYEKAGARIVDTAAEIFASADIIIKVKEPQPVECAMLRPGQLLYTYLHLAPDPEQTAALNPRNSKGQPDAVHLGPEGSAVFARLVVEELRRAAPELARCLLESPAPLNYARQESNL